MELRSILVSMLAALLVGGCAASADGTAKNPLDQEIGKSEPRGVLLPKCRVPCSVSPGPDCC